MGEERQNMFRDYPTIEELKQNPLTSKRLEQYEKKYDGKVPQELIDKLSDSLVWYEITRKQVVHWIGETNKVAFLILNDRARASDVCMGGIRLYEIINTLPGHFKKHEKQFSSRTSIKDPHILHHISHGECIRLQLLEIKNKVTKNELFVLEFQRNRHAHIFQTHYRFKVEIKENGEIKTDKSYGKFKGIPLRELQQIIDSEMKKYEYSDVAFLKELLNRFEPHLMEIAGRIEHWAR
jgi:hypothetical protein